MKREELGLAAVTALPKDSKMGLTAEMRETKSMAALLMRAEVAGEFGGDDEDEFEVKEEANCLRIIFAASVLPAPD